ncbi:hypothetical protein BGZ54_007200 [Gamsiella multidivaricata]|nr:hypothetical protein BGZ54_007200 [Gamsiella multidivaricata]
MSIVMFTVPNGDGSVLMHVYGTSIISNSITFAIFDKTRHIFVEQNATWSTPIGSGTPNAFAVTSMNFGNSTVALKIIPLNPTATPSTSSSIKVISAPASMGTSCSLFSGTVRGAILGNDYYIFCSNSGRSLNYLATSDGITFNAPVKVNTSIGYPESFFPFASTPGSGVTWAFMNNDTSIAGLTLSGPNIGAWQDMNYSINVTGWSNPNGGSSGSSDGSFGGSSNSIFKGGVPVSAIIGIVIACLTVLCVVSTWTCRYMARRKRLQSVEVVHASCMPLQQTSTTFVPPTFENYEHGQQYQMYPPPPSVQAHQSHDQPEMSPAPAYTPYPTKNDEMGASLSSPYIPATTASVSSTPTFAQPQHLQQYPGTAVGRPQTDVQEKEKSAMCGGGKHDAQQQQPGGETLAFPGHLYSQLTDAHCHIQDDRQNINSLVHSWSSSSDKSTSSDATVAPLLTGKVCLMGVQPSKDLGLPVQDDGSISISTAALSLNSSSVRSSSTPVVTVSWSDTDTQGDWDLVSKLAQDHPDRFVPCFGIHPWFTHKYRPLEGSTGSGIELRGVSAGGAAEQSAEGASPTLSFSSAFLTPVPEPGLRREAFLAMSKQLQEQMAKENQEKVAAGDNDDGAQEGMTHQDAAVGSNAVEENGANAKLMEISTHQQHDPRFAHYQKVLGLPTSASEEYLRDLSKRLPEPRALEPALKELRRQLEAHPHAVVGEIGLDRTARVPEPSIPSSSSTTATTTAGCDNGDKEKKDPNQKRTTLALTSIQHQLDIVREQLKLAASLNRAVSFHCVQAYGHWHDFLIQEGRRLKQMEAGNDYQLQLQQIHASGGTAAISPISPSGIRLSKKSAARLRKEARDAAWERHVASTLQESSDEDEDDEESGDDKDESRSGDDGSKSVASSTLNAVTMTTTTAAGTSGTDESTVAPKYEPVLPPRLCMHSYGGSIDMLKAFTKLDHPPEIFFSFSILINGRLQEKKLRELILAVPEDRLLIESDHHSHTQVDRLLVEMASKVAEIRGWTIEKTVERSARNWQRFVYG